MTGGDLPRPSIIFRAPVHQRMMEGASAEHSSWARLSSPGSAVLNAVILPALSTTGIFRGSGVLAVRLIKPLITLAPTSRHLLFLAGSLLEERLGSAGSRCCHAAIGPDGAMANRPWRGQPWHLVAQMASLQAAATALAARRPAFTVLFSCGGCGHSFMGRNPKHGACLPLRELARRRRARVSEWCPVIFTGALLRGALPGIGNLPRLIGLQSTGTLLCQAAAGFSAPCPSLRPARAETLLALARAARGDGLLAVVCEPLSVHNHRMHRPRGHESLAFSVEAVGAGFRGSPGSFMDRRGVPARGGEA